MRVLVAEDDRGLREVLVQGLEEAGYFVDAVAAGDEAIEQLRFYEYDVAVLDWRMPIMSGLDVVQWIRRRQLPTAVLMLTARDAPADRVTGLDDLSGGFRDYVPDGVKFVHGSITDTVCRRQNVAIQRLSKIAMADENGGSMFHKM